MQPTHSSHSAHFPHRVTRRHLLPRVARTLIACALIALAATATAAAEPGDHAMTFTSTCDGTTQPYRMFIPSAAKTSTAPLPLLVVLHGMGANYNTWFDRTPVKAVAERFGYVAVAPQARGDWFYRGPAEQDVLDIVADVARIQPVNPDRVFVMGHSMGGWGAWWMALRNPGVFASTCPMAGMVPMDLLPSARNLSPFVIHDDIDPIVRVENSREPAAALARAGLSVQYREESGYGHASRMIGDNLPRILEWFNDHPRKTAPKHVTLASRTPRKASAWWLRILETTDYPKTATVDARIDTTGTMHVRTEHTKRFALDVAALSRFTTTPLEVNVDGQILRVMVATGWAEFTAGRRPGAWGLRAGADEVPQPPADPLITRVDPRFRTTAGADLFTTTIANLLRRRLSADVAVFRQGAFRLPAGDLTADKVIDLFVFPEERLGLYRCTGADLARAKAGKLLEAVDIFPASASRKSGRAFSVIAPLNLNPNLGRPLRTLPGSIPEYLLEILRSRWDNKITEVKE
jgi:poly(3-hydroxybutyrate) depolymerase